MKWMETLWDLYASCFRLMNCLWALLIWIRTMPPSTPAGFPPTLYDILEEDLSAAGMLEKWPTYHYNASRLQGICKKYNVEKVRKCHELTAYEFLGMRGYASCATLYDRHT